MPNTWLSKRLAPLFEQGFFRPLGRPSAPLYVDCADRLEAASDEGGQLSHTDALALIRDAVAAHPRLELDEDEGAQFADLRQRAGQIFNRLLEAGWLEERPVSLDERWVVISPRVAPLLALLREFAKDDLAELKDFAATVRSVCETLLAEGALEPARRTPEELRQFVKELLDRVSRAGQQMRAVETVMLRQAQKQRVSASPGETLHRFLVEIHEGEHWVCYDTLERGGLLPKLKQARLIAQDAVANPFTKQWLAKGVAAQRGGDETAAYGEAEDMLSRLERGLAGLSAKQRIIDARFADFGKADARVLSLLDYRNYHRYDIKVRPADRTEGPEISFSRSEVNLSGGENQAPFFISMLAAARRVYDLGGGRSQHIGLVVMDEAFSKLSGDGVEDCLELARNFNLQLLMAFPIDRLGVMAPFADTVVELRKEIVRDAAGYVVQLDNIPIILSPDQVQETLA